MNRFAALAATFVALMCSSTVLNLAFGAGVGFSFDSAANDTTDRYLAQYQTQGVKLLQRANSNSSSFQVLITKASEALIEKKSFDIADNQFELNAFTDFVVTRFVDSLAYFKKVVPESPIAEFYVVIADLGDERKTTLSQTKTGSRIIEIDLRRWHKLFRGYHSFLAEVTSIHEFTHVNNYFLDPNEDKKHRELTAIVFESLNLIRLYGTDIYVKNYLKKVSSPLSNPKSVLNESYADMPPLRAIAHSFFSKVIKNIYKTKNLRSDVLVLLESFAKSYLVQKKIGAAGFDATLELEEFLDQNENRLTLSRIQQDLYEELTGSSGPRFSVATGSSFLLSTP